LQNLPTGGRIVAFQPDLSAIGGWRLFQEARVDRVVPAPAAALLEDAAAGQSPLLTVPSAFVPETFNVLLNPGHHDATRIAIAQIRVKRLPRATSWTIAQSATPRFTLSPSHSFTLSPGPDLRWHAIRTERQLCPTPNNQTLVTC